MSGREECDKFKADRDVFKYLPYYVSGRCEEHSAGHISDKERADFCYYFESNHKIFKTLNKQKSDLTKA
jgi:hypothetical protein